MRQMLTRRLARLAPIAALTAAGGLAGCNDFLTAENPGAIVAEDVTDARYATLLTNGVIGEFQPMLGYVTWWNAIFTDELHNRATFFEEGLIDRREITPENGTYAFFYYGNLHRTRFLADDGASRLKTILGDSASRDLRLARVQAYGGMTYTYIAEALCAAPIDLSAPLPPSELFARAIERFDETIAVAAAAKTQAKTRTPIVPRDTLAADSLRNFALIGAARASLNVNDKAGAIAYASQVPANFEFRAYYAENSTRENSWMWNRLVAGSNGTMLNTPFAAMDTDPRIPRPGGTTVLALIPNAPPSYDAYSGTLVGADFSRGGWVRVASSLEAQYIIAEAQGATPATLAFVNERRAVGMQAPVSLDGAALMAELRDQRSRDFYLDNHRLGDLRRYKEFYGVDLFPQGAYPGTTTGLTYSAETTCWPLTRAEINSNPNVPQP